MPLPMPLVAPVTRQTFPTKLSHSLSSELGRLSWPKQLGHGSRSLWMIGVTHSLDHCFCLDWTWPQGDDANVVFEKVNGTVGSHPVNSSLADAIGSVVKEH